MCLCSDPHKDRRRALLSRIYVDLRHWKEQPVFKARMDLAEWVLSLREPAGKELFWLVALQYWNPIETTCLCLRRISGPNQLVNRVTLTLIQLVQGAAESDSDDDDAPGPAGRLLWQSLAHCLTGYDINANLTLRAWRIVPGAPTGAPTFSPQRIVVELEGKSKLISLVATVVVKMKKSRPQKMHVEERT